jgi:hypothetical protein
MATKKNTPKATANTIHKRRPSKTDKPQTAPAEAALEAELVTAVVMEATATPMTELSQTVTPMPAAAKITPAEPAPQPPMPSNQAEISAKHSALDAAAKVLAETGQAISCTELIAAMAAKGYWSSPKGRTPAATLYAALRRELQTKGDQARFRKTGRGKFALRPTE